ncbi:MAG: c-type cytochrome [Planctomycetota bacterium]|nr:c-type cytochrome [Planctomycetota bacterium]
MKRQILGSGFLSSLFAVVLGTSVGPRANAFQKISDAKVERLAPLSLDEVRAAIEVQPGFEVELVASEPLIQSPVAMSFDASGALWVVEMVDYSEQENDSLGRLSKLTDTDSDGQMDHAEVIAERLSWPTALATFDQRTWVAAAPLVLEFSAGKESTENQGVWTSRRLLEGLGRQNVQGLANSFRWGLDGRMHLSTSSNGGQLVTSPGSNLSLPSSPFGVSGRDIACDVVSGKVSTVVGYGQHGMDFSPWGDRFVTSNSDHLQQVIAWYLPELTDAGLSKAVAWRRSVATDGSQAEVFRISPVESWRAIRTQMRLSGVSTGILEGQGRASGYFTSATGVTIYDGDQWPATETPLAFIADVGSNLVHRKRLVRSGVYSKGERIDPQGEFLRSKDTWFRPVQFSNGPDGCLYIVDMARETIEHPKSIPEPIKSQVDLTSGKELGRIWRVRATGSPIRRDRVALATLSTEQLASQLDHPNGWHRETASQLLIERQAPEAIGFCRQTVASSQRELGRLYALSVLAAIPTGLDKPTWLHAIEDPSVHVRLWAWVFADRLGEDTSAFLPKESERVHAAMVRESDLEVQMAMAVRSLSVVPREQDRIELFASWLKRMDPAVLACDELRAGIEVAIRGKSAKKLWEQEDWLTFFGRFHQANSFLDAMLFQMHQHGDLVAVLKEWDQQGLSSERSRVATEALGRLSERRILAEGSEAFKQVSQLASRQLVPRMQAALDSGRTDRQAEADLGQTDSERSSTIRLLGTLPIAERQEMFVRVLSQCASASIQSEVIEAWVPGQPVLQQIAVKYLDGTNPWIEQSIFKALIRNEQGAKLLLDRLEESGSGNSVGFSTMPAWVWQALRAFPTEGIKSRAQRLSPVSEVPWESVASKYRDAWDKPGDAKQGQEHFRKLCASCHQVMDIGIPLGPSLDSYRVRPNEAIGLAIAEPSREMDPKYEQQLIRTTDGEVASGILIRSSQDQITIQTAQNQSVSIRRSEIQEWKSSGRSLMPDGLLKELDATGLNDLIAFLRLVPPK